eukprot:CAMPEP_0113639852 /NCGR_PEP_ID=MMETSP0017_2-20120614/20914_1 /TAXON_ID=2856 /ORGANISM="Cylindrotheca closterium" /LENGTH=72 /DNA_ID=CAMNT_0000551101 /DNA_START=43 /DNA_END=261 /DNA_ORIENTATION=+ /assembly_acc=CAM_ASM_000147
MVIATARDTLFFILNGRLSAATVEPHQGQGIAIIADVAESDDDILDRIHKHIVFAADRPISDARTIIMQNNF